MTDSADAAAAVRERFDRFARTEAPGRSELYAEWASGIAGDARACASLARIPPQHRQPPLVFAVARLLGAPLAPYAQLAGWLDRNGDELVAECTRRSLQTNDPLRCAALLPALSLIEGPIALLEVGAAAGLCLYPDRYSYRYRAPGHEVRRDPTSGASPVVLESRLIGDPRLRLPEVVWRAGIDPHPLDAQDAADRAWLVGLAWPGEAGRAERITAALDIVAADPPRLFAGDAAEILGDVCELAPVGATLVVTTPGVLPHVPRRGRERIIAAARAAGRWITLDQPSLHEAWRPPIDAATWPNGSFALALDGRVLAAADPLGAFVEWRAEDAEAQR